MLLRLLLMFLLPESSKPRHVRKFVAGTHVRVSLTLTATSCVHALFSVYTKCCTYRRELFYLKINPHLSLLLQTHKSTKLLLIRLPVITLCCCKCDRKNTVWPRVVPEEPPTVWKIIVMSTDTLSSLLFTELYSKGVRSSVMLENSLAQTGNHTVSKSKKCCKIWQRWTPNAFPPQAC